MFFHKNRYSFRKFKKSLPWVYYSLPILSVALVAFSIVVLISILNLNGVPSIYGFAEAFKAQEPINASVNSLNAQIKWGISALILIVAVVANLVICIRMIISSPCKRSDVAIFSVIVSMVAFFLVSLASLLGISFSPKCTVVLLSEGYTFAAVNCDSMNFAISALNGLAATSIAITTVAASTIMIDVYRDDSIINLADKMNSLTTLLHSAAIVLVVGVYEINMLYQWPAELLVGLPAAAQTPFISLSETVTFAAGAIFSLTLVGIYLPSASIIRALARKGATQKVVIAGLQPTLPNITAEMTALGFTLSPVQQVLKLLVTAGPLIFGTTLSGLVSTLLSIHS